MSFQIVINILPEVMDKSLVLLIFKKLSWKRKNKLLGVKVMKGFTGAVKPPVKITKLVLSHSLSRKQLRWFIF